METIKPLQPDNLNDLIIKDLKDLIIIDNTPNSNIGLSNQLNLAIEKIIGNNK